MKEIPFEQLNGNAAELIGKQWMLITAGTPDAGNCNMMTASWGGLGFLWNRPVAYVFVRPNRHTRPLIDAQESFTLSFMPERYRDELMFCGRNSGRDCDKFEQTSLQALCLPSGLTAMQDADIVLECRKMYVQAMEEKCFLDYSEVSPRYYGEGSGEELHLLYIAEISHCYLRGES